MAEDKIEKKAEENSAAPTDPNALIAQFQIMQQQLQNVMIQKESLNMSIMEIDRAIEELGKTSEKSAYKMTGTIMVKKDIEELKKDLADSKEVLGVRMKSIEGTEKNLTEKLKSLQDQLKQIIK